MADGAYVYGRSPAAYLRTCLPSRCVEALGCPATPQVLLRCVTLCDSMPFPNLCAYDRVLQSTPTPDPRGRGSVFDTGYARGQLPGEAAQRGWCVATRKPSTWTSCSQPSANRRASPSVKTSEGGREALALMCLLAEGHRQLSKYRCQARMAAMLWLFDAVLSTTPHVFAGSARSVCAASDCAVQHWLGAMPGGPCAR